MARQSRLSDLIDPDQVEKHRPRMSRPHVALEFLEAGKQVGPGTPRGRIKAGHPSDGRELVKHLFPYLQDRVLYPTRPKVTSG